MNTKTNLALLIGSLLTLFCSCEGVTSYEKQIINNTTDTLEVMLIANTSSSSITETVLPLKSKTIQISESLGAATTTSSCTNDIDSIHISCSSGRSLIKDPYLNDNWNVSIYQQSRSHAIHDCQFVINPSDLQ